MGQVDAGGPGFGLHDGQPPHGSVGCAEKGSIYGLFTVEGCGGGTNVESTRLPAVVWRKILQLLPSSYQVSVGLRKIQVLTNLL